MTYRRRQLLYDPATKDVDYEGRMGVCLGLEKIGEGWVRVWALFLGDEAPTSFLFRWVLSGAVDMTGVIYYPFALLVSPEWDLP